MIDTRGTVGTMARASRREEPPVERLYTTREVAELWSASDDKVRAEIRADRLRHVRIGRLIRVPASALREYIERFGAVILLPPALLAALSDYLP